MVKNDKTVLFLHFSLPQPRRHHMACVLGSVIYLLGGFGRHRVRQSSVDAYDTESGRETVQTLLTLFDDA